MTDLPDYYFRVRENGAAVFRLNPETRLRRLDLEQIAVANLRNGEIRAQGDYKLSEADLTAIRDWMADNNFLERSATTILSAVLTHALGVRIAVGFLQRLSSRRRQSRCPANA